MDKVITSALLIIASVIAAVALINAVIPAMGKSSSALVAANSDAADRIRTDIAILHVASDTSSGFSASRHSVSPRSPSMACSIRVIAFL